MVATRYQSAIDSWIAEGRAEGYQISWDSREQFGFPRHAVLRFVNLRWKNIDGIEFHAGDLDIGGELWQTKKFVAKFKGKVEIDVPLDGNRGQLILAGEGGTAHVTLTDDGVWEDCNIDMKAAQVGRLPDYVFVAGALNLTATRPDIPPSSIKEPGLTLMAEATDVSLPTAMPETFGPKIAHLETSMRLMGNVPDFRKKDSVATWNQSLGAANFDKLNMQWGPLLLASKGTIGFDDDLQPEGAFAATIGHQDQVLELLMKAGFIAESQQSMLGSAMHLFAKPTPIGGTEGVAVPVAVQLGGLFLGPVKIFSFPQIEWQ